jgi:DNA helicase-2/ATP-dependent DNA helicase PcrA
LEEGLFPIGESAFDEKELEEERRLAYVGITRARRFLTLTAASSRKIYGRSNWHVPSRFVAEAGLTAERPVPSGLFESVEPAAAAPRPAAVASFDPDEGDTASPGGQRPLRIGQRVRHPMFGEGKILDKNGSGENLKVTVLFDSGARKSILVRYANFEPTA